jgi:hypothetical protein
VLREAPRAVLPMHPHVSLDCRENAVLRFAMTPLLLLLTAACSRSSAPQLAVAPEAPDAAVPLPVAQVVAPTVSEEPAPALVVSLAVEAASIDTDGPVTPQSRARPLRVPSHVIQVDARSGHTRDADGCLSPPLQAFDPYKESFERPIVAVFGRDARARLVPIPAAPWHSADGGAPQDDQLQDTLWYAVDCARPGYVHVQAAYFLPGGSEGFSFEAAFEGKRWRLIRRHSTWIE